MTTSLKSINALGLAGLSLGIGYALGSGKFSLIFSNKQGKERAQHEDKDKSGSWNKRAKDPKPPESSEAWVEVYDEPRHFVEMDNEFCRIIRFRFPPKDKTLFHRHSVDSFFVFFNSTRVRNEQQGHPMHEFEIEAGNAAGACYCTEPIIHRISNLGPNWMHGLDIEIKSLKTKEYKTKPLKETRNIELIFDNKTKGGKRMRVYMLSISTGESVKNLSFIFPKLCMCYKGGKLKVDDADGFTKEIVRYRGTYWWNAEAFKGSITNIGDSEYKVMIAEWH
mmetsp:Transcript_26375/g.36820  ORF Transcript_26375/g.36820 Transcript_26375/m.36820 type:complete len:279 (+) Transcript_26375:65-901(+)